MIPQFATSIDKPIIAKAVKEFPYRMRPFLIKKSKPFYNSFEFDFDSFGTDSALDATLDYLDEVKKVLDGRGYKHEISGTYYRLKLVADFYASMCRKFFLADNNYKGLSNAWAYAVEELGIDYMFEYPNDLEIDLSVVFNHVELKLSCEKFWTKALKKKYNRALENASRDINIVNSKEGIYCSNENVARYEAQCIRTKTILENTNIINELDEKFSLKEVYDKSVSNLENRRAELNIRSKGMGDYARSIDNVADFWTCTLPPRMHSSRGITGNKIKTYDGTTTRDGQKHFTKVFSQVRSLLAREDIFLEGLRIVEPHKDGCAHWHAIFFFKNNDDRYRARKVMENYLRGYREPRYSQKGKLIKGTGIWLSEFQGQVRGASKRRFEATNVIMDDNFSVIGYLLKYISKNIDGKGQKQGELFEQTQDEINSVRVRAWASVHGIRQFQFVGSHKVSVWRELRKIKHEELVKDTAFFDAWHAATQSVDWCAFMKAMDKNTIELLKVWNDENGAYGMPKGEQVVGLIFGKTELITRVHKWRIEVKDNDFEKNLNLKNNGLNGKEVNALHRIIKSKKHTRRTIKDILDRAKNSTFSDISRKRLERLERADDFYIEIQRKHPSEAPCSSINNCTELNEKRTI